MPSCLLGVLDSLSLLAGFAIIFLVTWLALWFVGMDLRGSRSSWSLALSSLLLTALLYTTITWAVIGAPWWVLGIYIFLTGIVVFLYLSSIYSGEAGNGGNGQ